MGCSCNKNDMKLEQSNEMNEGRFETLGPTSNIKEEMKESNYVINNNENEIENSSIRLRGAPPPIFKENEKDENISFKE